MQHIKIELKWAVIFSIMMMLWMTMEMVTGLHGVNMEYHPIVTNFVAIPAILTYIYALRSKKRNFYDGKITYKQSFASSVLLTVFITVLSPICLYISMTFISPEYFDNAILFSVENGFHTQESAEAYFNFESYLHQSLVGSLIMGLVTGAIVSIFIRTKG